MQLNWIARVKLKYKLLLLTIPLLILISIATIYTGYNYFKEIQSAKKAVKWIHLNNLTGLIIHSLQKERGASVSYLENTKQQTFTTLMKRYRNLTDQDMLQLQTFIDKNMMKQYNTIHYENLKKQLEKIRNQVDTHSISGKQVLESYSFIIRKYLSLIFEIQKNINTIKFKEEILSYYYFLLWKDEIGKERAVLSKILLSPSMNPENYKIYWEIRKTQNIYYKFFNQFASSEIQEIYQQYHNQKIEEQYQFYRNLIYKKTQNSPERAIEWFRIATQKIDNLLAIEKKIETYLKNESENHYYQTLIMVSGFLFVVLFSLSITIYLIFLISNHIIKRLTYFIEISKEVAKNKKGLEIHIQKEERDEIGQLGNNLKHIYEEILNQFKEQDIRNQKNQNVIQKLETVMDRLLKSSTELSSTLEELSASFEEQASQSEEITKSAEKVSAIHEKNLSEIQNLKSISEEMIQSIQKQGENALSFINEVKNLYTFIDNVSNSVNELIHSIENIGDLLGEIEDITDQTNLLSLNAAIESAKAGEHGKGFSIVAEEIKKLSLKTIQFTKEIQGNISLINEKLHNTRIIIKETTQKTTGMKQIADTSFNSLKVILDTSEKIKNIQNQVSTSFQDQFSSNEQILRNIKTINQILQETTTNINEISNLSMELKQIAEILKEVSYEFVGF